MKTTLRINRGVHTTGCQGKQIHRGWIKEGGGVRSSNYLEDYLLSLQLRVNKSVESVGVSTDLRRHIRNPNRACMKVLTNLDESY